MDLAGREVWLVDFEFNGGPGDNPVPVCLVAREYHSGRTIRLWQDEFGPKPPYPTGPHTLFVAYYASAEIGCHLALGWPVPERILDLFTEFRCLRNGQPTVGGNGLLGAMSHYGLDNIGADEKEEMRNLILRGDPWSVDEIIAILEYCAGDVEALSKLLPAMAPEIDLPRALFRGRFMAAAARMEREGVPVDLPLLEHLRTHWAGIQDRLIDEVDSDFGVYEGRTFKEARFEEWLGHQGIPWPRLESGRLSLEDQTFRDMTQAYPALRPLRELRVSLSKMRLNDLQVGSDGRNRTLLSAFRARSGRNAPSNTKFIFGPSTWLRSLIKPPEGYGLAYVDWQQQEFGIAAALSGDEKMTEAYLSGDPYLAFAKQAGGVPSDATKQSHALQREQFKACALATQYGIGADSLAIRIGRMRAHARELLNLHRQTYSVFWRWNENIVDRALLLGELNTVFGWRLRVPDEPNPRSLGNYPMQANGAEMLRLACCMATEQGIWICAPVHDAVLIVAPLERLEDDIITMRSIMAEASRIVLAGFELRTDVSITRYPDRYIDIRGVEMWDRVMRLMGVDVTSTGC
jgi:DNA polymerase I